MLWREMYETERSRTLRELLDKYVGPHLYAQFCLLPNSDGVVRRMFVASRSSLGFIPQSDNSHEFWVHD